MAHLLNKLRSSGGDLPRQVSDPTPEGICSDKKTPLVKRSAALNLPPLQSSRRDVASFEPASTSLSPKAFRRFSDFGQLDGLESSSSTQLPALSQSPRPARRDAARFMSDPLPQLSQSPRPIRNDAARFMSDPSPDLSQSPGPTCKDAAQFLSEPLPDRTLRLASPRARSLVSRKFSSEPVKISSHVNPGDMEERLLWEGPRRASLQEQPGMFENRSEDTPAAPPGRHSACACSRQGSELWAKVRRAWRGKTFSDDGLVSDLLRTHVGNQLADCSHEVQSETSSDLAQTMKWLHEEWGSEVASPQAVAALTLACGGVSASLQIEALTLQDEISSIGLRGLEALSHVLCSKHEDLEKSFRWFNCFGSGTISRAVFDTGLLLLHVHVDDLTGMRNQDIFEMIARPGQAFLTLDDWKRAFEADGALSEEGQTALKCRSTSLAERASLRQASFEGLAQDLEAKEREAKEHVAEEIEAKQREARELEATKCETKDLEAKQREATEHVADELEAKQRGARESEASQREAKDQEAKQREAKGREAQERDARERELKELEDEGCEAREREARVWGSENMEWEIEERKNPANQVPVQVASKTAKGIRMGDAKEDHMCDQMFAQYSSKTGILRRPDVAKFTKDAYRVIKSHGHGTKCGAGKGYSGRVIPSLDFSQQIDKLFEETLQLQVDIHSRYSHGLTQYFFKVFVTKVACCFGWIIGGFLLAFLEDLENSSDTGILSA